jgi:hypothetical protein
MSSTKPHARPECVSAFSNHVTASGWPLLGIAIPAYKREALLGRLLNSIQAEWPIVVSDNGGHLSDGFMARHHKVRFHAGPEVTAVKNWNRAASELNTEWIIMPGDDDLYYQSSFSIIESTLRASEEADIVFFGHHIIDEHDSLCETWQPEASQHYAPKGFELIRLGASARPPSIVFRKRLFDKLNGFDEQFAVTAGDNHFYQRASLIGNVVFCPDVVSGYRVWSAGSTQQTIATPEWLREIDLWCDGVREFASTHTSYQYTDALRDEIYTANLRAGIGSLKSRGQYLGAWRHLLTNRYPYRASLLSQAKLIAHLLLPRRK